MVQGIWIRAIGDHVELLAEVDGKWRFLCRERLDSAFSHIVEPIGIHAAPLDPITDGPEEPYLPTLGPGDPGAGE